ncbi:MAG: ADOP family duplicated permease [Gemmatimonadota bacterium]
MGRRFFADFRESIRSLARAPRFALACIAVLGLGIGLSTAMFATLNAVLLRPLPVSDQDRVIVAWRENRARQADHVPTPLSQARTFAERSRTLGEVAFADRYFSQPLLLADGVHSLVANGDIVTGTFFHALGATPVLGRLFEPNDDRVGAEDVAVVSYRLWQREFGGASSVLGRQLSLHGSKSRFRIIGVAPQGFDYPAKTEIWMPLVPANPAVGEGEPLVDLYGRMVPGASPRAVAAELSAFLHEAERPEILRGTSGEVHTLPEVVLGDVRGAFVVFCVAVAVLLLIACINVAGLLLMRGVQMYREIAVRNALGASTVDIVRRQMAESVVLAGMGSVVGIGIAWGAVRLVRMVAPADLPRFDQIHLDPTALMAALLIALCTAMVFGIGPALVAARMDAAHLLRAGAVSLSGGRRHAQVREGLVVAQVAAAVVVLAVAGLVARSLLELQQARLGYEKERVMVFELGWDFDRMGTPDASRAYFDRLLPTLSAIRGVAAASALILAPFPSAGWDLSVVAADRSREEQTNNPALNLEMVSPSYFAVFQMPALRGRVLNETDREGAPRAVVLSESAATLLWPSGDAVGRQIMRAKGDTTRWTVVGIVADTRYREYRHPSATLYFSQHQPLIPIVATMVAIRTTADDPLSVVPQITAALHETDAGTVVSKVATMQQYLDGPLAQPRFNAMLLSLLAIAAALIVAVGLYVVLAFAVQLRNRELAIRAALGASPTSLCAMVLRAGARIVGGGLVIGLVLTFVVSRLIDSMLYNIASTDPLSIAAALGLLVSVAVIATFIPARRASRAPVAVLLRDG